MKAQCCICSDLFDWEGDSNISAVACGHTFHEVCLRRWLQTSSTCPHCREPVNQEHIVKKLYFDQAEAYGETTHNLEKLIKEVDHLRLELREEQKHAEEAKKRINQKIEDMETWKNSIFKRLLVLESRQRTLESEREEYMKNIRHLLEDSRCDSDAQYGLGEDLLRHVATVCVVLNLEYHKSKTGKKLLKDKLEKQEKQGKDLLHKEVSSLEIQLRYSEDSSITLTLAE